MNIASIDIGTNTVLLLIAEINGNNIKPLLNIYRMPRLGKELNKTGKIANEKIRLLIDILNEYKSICQEYNCSFILPFATQAMRTASNNKEVIKEVFDKTGLQIEIISGEIEANLSFIGAISNIANHDNYVVIDIGGGSTEIIYGNFDKIYFAKSFKIGVVTLTEQFFSNGYSDQSIFEIINYVKSMFNFPFNIDKNTAVIAVAGTPTSLYGMRKKIKEYKDELVENGILTTEDITELIEILKKLTPQQALLEFGQILDGREDLILSGALLLNSILEKLNTNKTIVSTRGLRYGIIYNYLADNKWKI